MPIDTSTAADDMPRRQHTIAAVAAAVLSVIIHIAVMLGIANTEFDVDSYAPRRRVRDIVPTKVREFNRVISESKRPDALASGDSTFTVDMAERVKDLASPPEEAQLEPVALVDEKAIADSGHMAEPSPLPDVEMKDARREILMIEDRVIKDDVREAGRKLIPIVERVREVRDEAGTMERGKAVSAAGTGGLEPRRAEIGSGPVGRGEGTVSRLVIDEPKVTESESLFVEPPAAVTRRRPIEEGLVVDIATYTSLRDRKYGYFRMQIRRDGETSLPVIPKDIIFVQDCSASMAEQRLYFCRSGLTNCLSKIGPDDRFNIAGFRDVTTMCFPQWTRVSDETLGKAREFIGNMTSEGNTDIFAAIKGLVNLERSPGRPVIAVLVTDGRSTTGITKSADIIGEFSKLNDGAISVFAMGTLKTANTYLLDLLSYCNRGGSDTTKGGRWGIPDTMNDIVRQVSRPVMSDVSFRFAARTYCEVYPVLTSNLYLDRSLVVYGRYPRDMPQIVFQAVGTSGEQLCDMVFNVALGGRTEVRDDSIRGEWARQKIYHLMGSYARRPDPGIQQEISDTAGDYGVDLPHRPEVWSR